MLNTKKRATRMTVDNRKQLILKTAMKLAKRIGYYNLMCSVVAANAKVSKALVHKYFDTTKKLKNSVLRAAIGVRDIEIIAQGVMRKDPLTKKIDDELRQDALKQFINRD